MPKQMTAEQKLTYMTETPLPRLVLSLSVPTIVSMPVSYTHLTLPTILLV